MLNSSKAKKILNWKTNYSSSESIFETTEWYKRYYDNKNMIDFTIKQIQNYVKRVESK